MKIKGILEFKGNQIIIEVPEAVEKMSDALLLLDHIPDRYLLNEVWSLLYQSIENYFELEAVRLFRRKKIFLDGFTSPTKEMLEKGIHYYCIMKVDNANIRSTFEYADGSIR